MSFRKIGAYTDYMLNKAVIDLGKLRNNAKELKMRLKGGARFNAVVKANAYGHGDAECANALYDIADSFSVALAEEGIKLRRAGIDKEILVLIEPFVSDVPAFVRFSLTASVSRIETLAALNEEAGRQNTFVTAHIKINSGMNRQGVAFDKAEELADAFDRFPRVKLTGIYSHFCAPEDKNALNLQLDKFLLAYKLISGYNRNICAHISASGGYLRGVHLDMCRIGLLLYGYYPFESDFAPVEPVMKVVAPTVAVREAARGEYLLYGSEKLSENQKFSLIRYGYADGLPRKKSGNLLKNRCMDLSAVEGERESVNVLENAEKLAEENGTIVYELLCGAANRAERIYLK